MIHTEIKPLKVFIKESVLFNEDSSKTNLVPATIFCISSYEKEALTFGVYLDNGSVFFYIPIHKISFKEDSLFDYQLNELIYNNNEAATCSVNYFEYLKKTNPKIYLKKIDKWINCNYILTIDWYQGNDLMHLVALENGQFACMPSHKINFAGKEVFENYKKIKSSWCV